MNLKRDELAGFTLTEMLVALFITALISTAGAALLVSASRSGKQLDVQAQTLQSIEVAQALIRNDMAALVPYTFDLNNEFGVETGLAWRSSQTNGPIVQFYRNGWLQAQEDSDQSDLQAVEYVLESGQLFRIAHLPGNRRDDQPRRKLFENVARIEMRIKSDGSWNSVPGSNQTGDASWPELVELTMIFTNDHTLRIVSLSGARS